MLSESQAKHAPPRGRAFLLYRTVPLQCENRKGCAEPHDGRRDKMRPGARPFSTTMSTFQSRIRPVVISARISCTLTTSVVLIRSGGESVTHDFRMSVTCASHAKSLRDRSTDRLGTDPSRDILAWQSRVSPPTFTAVEEWAGTTSRKHPTSRGSHLTLFIVLRS